MLLIILDSASLELGIIRIASSAAGGGLQIPWFFSNWSTLAILVKSVECQCLLGFCI